MSWGPLRFVDSMNVFPTSLASMIDDLRACTHKHLEEEVGVDRGLQGAPAGEGLWRGLGLALGLWRSLGHGPLGLASFCLARGNVAQQEVEVVRFRLQILCRTRSNAGRTSAGECRDSLH